MNFNIYRHFSINYLVICSSDLLPTTLSPTTCRTAKLASLSCFTFVTQSSRTYLEIVRQTLNLVLKTYSFPRNEGDLSTAALDAACDENGGKCPDAVFLCAGSARPGFFIEENEASLRQDMDQCYWVQAWSALVSQLIRSSLSCLPPMNQGCVEAYGTGPFPREDRFRVFRPRVYVHGWLCFIRPGEACFEG